MGGQEREASTPAIDSQPPGEARKRTRRRLTSSWALVPAIVLLGPFFISGIFTFAVGYDFKISDSYFDEVVDVAIPWGLVLSQTIWLTSPFARYSLFRALLLVLLFGPLAGIFMFGAFLLNPVGYVLNSVYGKDSFKVVHVVKKGVCDPYSLRRCGGCSPFVKIDTADSDIGNGRLCPSEALWSDIRPGDPLLLRGRGSVYGFEIQGMSRLDGSDTSLPTMSP